MWQICRRLPILLSRTRCSVLHAAPQRRDPDAAAWVPALRRATSCRAASGTRISVPRTRCSASLAVRCRAGAHAVAEFAPHPESPIVHLHRPGKAAYLDPYASKPPCKVLVFGIPALLIPGRAAGRPAGADPDAAGRADGLYRADRSDPFAGSAAGGTGELDHRRVRFHSEALRFHAAPHHLSRP